MIALLAGCGGDSGSAPGEPCAVQDGDGPFSTVDLLVNSPLPEVLSVNCPSANLEELEIFLTIPGQDSCFLEVVDGAVTGCCPQVVTDQNAYATSDPFSKLKYDDLRKVHKDQTVFAVSERDYDKMKTYSSIDHLQRERGSTNLTPLEKTHAEQILLEKEKAIQQSILSKKHADDLRTMEYAQKNKSVMASFFQLTMC